MAGFPRWQGGEILPRPPFGRNDLPLLRQTQESRNHLKVFSTRHPNRRVESNAHAVASRILERIQSDLLESDGNLTQDSDLFAAGLDSMAIMQLSLIVEEEFGLRLPESLISRSTFESAGKLAEVIGQLQRA
jgi:acyl carrier protein